MKTISRTAFDAIVLGAGAAGLMCAATAGQRARRVRVVERAKQPGKKILISGGGRCNFTNRTTPAECYLSENRHFAKSALGRYQPDNFIDLVNRHQINWHEKTLGQLFCDGSSKQIVRMLLDECAKGDVCIGLNETVGAITHADGQFHVTLDTGNLTAPALVLATGGPAIPKMGATGFAYDVARQFGLDIVTPRPALVPLTLGKTDEAFKALPGLSVSGIVRHGKTTFEEAFLFTHRGLSGPAILQISSYWSPGEPIFVNMTPVCRHGWLVDKKRADPRTGLTSAVAEVLPQRLAATLTQMCTMEAAWNSDLGNIPDRTLRSLEDQLAGWRFEPTGTEGFKKAEVTAGGIATRQLSSRTMETTTVPGLFAIGEAVDVTGWLGGYNFQWAWSSGYAAGQVI